MRPLVRIRRWTGTAAVSWRLVRPIRCRATIGDSRNEILRKWLLIPAPLKLSWRCKRVQTMKRALAACFLSIALLLPAAAVQAGGYGRGGHHHHGDDDLLIAAGIIGGAIVLSSLLTRPRYHSAPVYYQAAPVYYQPAPVYVPTCYQDTVWRRLPDGRIQTGIRTRCY